MAIHREVTFERGSVGRFVQRHGLRLRTMRVPRTVAPELVDALVSEDEDLYTLTFSGPHGSMETWLNRPKGRAPTIEEALVALGAGALDYEASGGDVAAYAAAFGADPDSPAVRRAFRDIRRDTELLAGLVGPEGYVELLDTVRRSVVG